MSDFVLEVLKIAEKTLGIYKLPLLVDAINDRGERRNHTLSGEGRRNSECIMRNQGRRGSTAYRRAQGSAAFRIWRTLIQKRDICGAAAAPAPVYGGRGQ